MKISFKFIHGDSLLVSDEFDVGQVKLAIWFGDDPEDSGELSEIGRCERLENWTSFKILNFCFWLIFITSFFK